VPCRAIIDCGHSVPYRALSDTVSTFKQSPPCHVKRFSSLLRALPCLVIWQFASATHCNKAIAIWNTCFLQPHISTSRLRAVTQQKSSKLFSSSNVFAVSVKWAKSGGNMKTKTGHEICRRESSKFLNHTMWHKMSYRSSTESLMQPNPQTIVSE